MRKLVITLIVLTVILSLFSFLGSAASNQYKIQHIFPVGTDIDKDVNWLASQLEERSNGRIVLDVYPAAQLGDYTVVQERVALGDIDMQLACLGTEMDRRLMVQSLPYLANNWEEVPNVFKSGTTLTNIIADLLEKKNIKLISVWPCYFGGILLTELPENLDDLADPSVRKNIKLRVPPQKTYELLAEALGYLPTPMSWSDVFTSLQAGVIDGAIGIGAESCYANFRDVVNYFLTVNDHLEVWYLYMNLDLWNSLSQEDQQLFQEIGYELEERRFAVAEQREQDNLQVLRDSDIEVISFTDEELSRFAKASNEYVLPKIEKDIGADILDQLYDK